MATSGSILGNAVLRREDPTLITGAGKYFDDLRFDGMLHVYFVRSPMAHATITSIDASEAETMPGVRKVYTHANIGLADFQAFPMMPEILNRPPLARDRVRFVGDIVAAIVADSKAEAVDAGEAVVVEYEGLPVAATIAAAAAPGAPLLFPEHGSNVCFGTQPSVPTSIRSRGRRQAIGRGQRWSASASPVRRWRTTASSPRSTCRWPPHLTTWISHQTPQQRSTARWPAMLGMEPEAGCASCARGSAAVSGPRRRSTWSTWSPPKRPPGRCRSNR